MDRTGLASCQTPGAPCGHPRHGVTPVSSGDALRGAAPTCRPMHPQPVASRQRPEPDGPIPPRPMAAHQRPGQKGPGSCGHPRHGHVPSPSMRPHASLQRCLIRSPPDPRANTPAANGRAPETGSKGVRDPAATLDMAMCRHHRQATCQSPAVPDSIPGPEGQHLRSQSRAGLDLAVLGLDWTLARDWTRLGLDPTGPGPDQAGLTPDARSPPRSPSMWRHTSLQR